jgi:hypothetical protein
VSESLTSEGNVYSSKKKSDLFLSHADKICYDKEGLKSKKQSFSLWQQNLGAQLC